MTGYGSKQTMVQSEDETALVRQLVAGDEAAFAELVTRYHASMVRMARSFVPTDAAAEDVAQEAWLAVVRGVERFECRSTVKTWLFRILINRAKTRGVRESRCAPFSSFSAGDGRSVHPDRFFAEGHLNGGHWSIAPQSWRSAPELRAESCETRECLKAALESLPSAQQAVLRMRDVLGFTAADVCAALNVSEANQRVLLHRGRSRMRAVLETILLETAEAS